MAMSVGQALINHHIPTQYRVSPGASTKEIHAKLEEWAKADPQSYAKNIHHVKRVADNIGMYEGLSMGMQDIAPMTKERAEFVKKYQGRMDAAKSDEDKKVILAEALQEGAKLTSKGSGSMIDMLHTGARGNPSQVMKNIITPVASRELDTTPYPYMITKSYSEGLTPGQYWVAGIEARNSVVEVKTHVAIPGDFGKQMFNTLNNMVVTVKDCGTRNGLYLSIDDHNIADRYLAKDIPGVALRNTLITSKVIMLAKKGGIKEIMVRSPMTCEARNGVCQMCYGLNSAGKLHTIGANVGTLAAQSLSEPLTQMALSTKHGVALAGKSIDDVGMKGVVKLLSKPQVFAHKATLATLDGTVDRISAAPQGGKYIYINSVEHYVAISNNPVVKVGQRVLKGDALSDGLKDPREVTMLKGIGTGRAYLADALYNAYNPLDAKSGKRTGMPIDKRHLEVLVKKDLNHVIVDDHNETFTRGDVVEYNKLKSYLADSKKEVPLKDAVGEYLAKEYLYHTVGTQVTPQIVAELQRYGISRVYVSTRKVNFTPYVTSLRQVPLLKENFIGRMSHHELKNSLMEAAQHGEKSEIKGYDPIPSFIQGVAFGEGEEGRY